jgi:hypothetical protein
MNPVRTSIVTATVLAAALAAGATGVALADNTATPTPRASTTATERGDAKMPGLRDGARKDRKDRKHRREGLGRLAGLGALHGEFVVKDGEGVFRTVVMQRGKATQVSAEEITVRSEDGYTATYAVTADTMVNSTRGGVDDIETGEDVNVAATKSGAKATARRIIDQSARGQMRERFGMDERPTGT